MSFKIPYFRVPEREDDNKSLFSYFRDLVGRWAGSELILYRVVPIGDWDMDATASVTVNYKSANDTLNFNRIRSVAVTILNDAGTESCDASLVKDGLDSVLVDTTEITLTRTTSGAFDNTSYDDTSINTRGFVMIGYIT